MALTYTVGCVLGSVIGGKILDLGGVAAMLVAASLFGILGAVITFLYTERIRN